MFFRRRHQAEAEAQPVPPFPPADVDPFRGDPDAYLFNQTIRDRDWSTAIEAFAAADAERQQWLLRVAGDRKDVFDWVDDFVGAFPDSPVPRTIKGWAQVEWAWDARGGGWARDVPKDAWAVFADRLRQAEDSLDEAVERDPSFVPARVELIQTAIGRSKPLDEFRRRFEAVVALDPFNVAGHGVMLLRCAKKWGGSSEMMFEFARSRAAVAPPGHDLAVLIADAHIEEWLIQGRADAYLEQTAVGDEIVAAAHQSIFHPEYRMRHGTTPLAWNSFAFALSLADRFDEAQRCFDLIGETYVTRRPWRYQGNSGETYSNYRTYVRDGIAYREFGAETGG